MFSRLQLTTNVRTPYSSKIQNVILVIIKVEVIQSAELIANIIILNSPYTIRYSIVVCTFLVCCTVHGCVIN